MNILLVPFLLQLSATPDYIVHATPLIKECEGAAQVDWYLTRGTFVKLDEYTIQVIPNGAGEYEAQANIPDSICGGFVQFEVTEPGPRPRR